MFCHTPKTLPFLSNIYYPADYSFNRVRPQLAGGQEDNTMRRAIFIASALAGLFLFTGTALCQSTYGPDTTTWERDIYKTASGSPASDGVTRGSSGNLTYQIVVGYDGTFTRRATYQWDLSGSGIPAGSHVSSAEVYFQYTEDGTDYFMAVDYYNIGVDLVSPSLDTIWNHFSSSYQIGSGQGYNYGQTGNGGSLDSVRTQFSSGSAFATALQNAISSGEFVLGIRATTDLQYSYLWDIVGSTVTLKIVYSPPGSMTIDQKVINGYSEASYGDVGVYQNGAFANYSVPFYMSFPLNSTQYLQADTTAVNYAGV